MSPVYTVHIIFLRAHHLPVGDILTLSSDPYVISTLSFPDSLPPVPKLHHRTPTIRRTRSPEWHEAWTVANVPATGIKLKLKTQDEDPAKHDDCLGIGYLETGPITGEFKKIYNCPLKLHVGRDPMIALTRVVSAGCHGWSHAGGSVDVEVTVTQHQPDFHSPIPRAYTIGPNWYSQHFSPLIGIITHTASTSPTPLQHYRFAATKLQLTGPVPNELTNRYVSYRPIIASFYKKSGIRGRLLNHALKKQYSTIYSYDRSTAYGVSGRDDLAHTFLHLTGWELAGRVYTYIITLDGEWRFTETGPEFGIQMLSKHTMHSDVSVFVAFAGEFFIRPSHAEKHPRKGHPADYELVIDNDSGTYRPDKRQLPQFEEFLRHNLRGMRVTVIDAFEPGHREEKETVAKEKEARGRRRFKQPGSRSSSTDSRGSFSSSDEEELRDGRVGFKGKVKRRLWEELEKESIDSLEFAGDRLGTGYGAPGPSGLSGVKVEVEDERPLTR